MEPGDVEGVTFRQKNGAETKFVFADLDAACWAAAVDRTYDLQTITGLSLLFRLLALIELMSKAPWLRPYFSLTAKDGATLDPLLLATAASEQLSNGAGFNALSFKAAMGIGEQKTLPAAAPPPPAKPKAAKRKSPAPKAHKAKRKPAQKPVKAKPRKKK